MKTHSVFPIKNFTKKQPRIILLDCPLEYKKGESQTSVELTKEEDWAALLKAEEESIQRMCDQIIAFKPDVVVTEKGLSDLAAHFFTKVGLGLRDPSV